MPLKPQNFFKCDYPLCDVEFYYDPGGPNLPPPQWDAATRTALERVVAITHAITGTVTFYCSDLHAIEAIGKGKHLPVTPPKVVPAGSEADVKAAAAGAKAVAQMKSPRPS